MKDSSPQKNPADPLVVQFNLLIHDASEVGKHGVGRLSKGHGQLLSRNPSTSSGTGPRAPGKTDHPSPPTPSRSPALEGSLDRERLKNLLNEKQVRDKASAGEPDIEISLVLYV